MIACPYLMRKGNELQTHVRANLAAFPREIARPHGKSRRAAVALVLTGIDVDPGVLLVKRAKGGHNPGQWALPGGRSKVGEDAVATALRESREEIGLQMASVAGLLDDFIAQSGYVITPVVVFAPAGATFVRQPREIHSVHPIRLARLLDADLPRWGRTQAGGFVLQLPLRRNMVVHAPTGAILWQFREVALLGRHTRVNGLTQPSFTRT